LLLSLFSFFIFKIEFLNVRSISNQSFADASNSYITRLPKPTPVRS
jgi:hypothetical protein